MGWWDEGIMGGDNPMDIESVWDETFDDIHNITSKQAIAFISKLQKKWTCPEEIIAEVVGFLMIEGVNKMSKKLKKIVIQAIDDEDTSGWNNPPLRRQRLTEFKTIVTHWDGSPVELPGQPGLFDTMFGQIAMNVEK